MTWARIDDSLWAHPKVAAIARDRLACMGLFLLAISWANKYLTDGQVPSAQVLLLGAKARHAQALVAAGLWDRASNGYVIHDFLEYNPSRASVLAMREARKAAGSKGGIRSGATRRRTRDEEGEAQQEARDEPPVKQKSGRNGDRTRTPEPEPAPVRTHVSSRESEGVAPSTRVDIAALKRHQGYVTPAQVDVLDEILDRHDLAGPSYAATIISRVPVAGDALREVMREDSAWQARRRMDADEAERAWQEMKAADRVRTPNV